MKGKHQDELRILQLVTQLERAGAQTMAAWLESELLKSSTPCKTLFLYNKSGSDLFASDRALAPRRPSNMVQWVMLLRSLGTVVAAMRPTVLVAHTHYSIAAGVLLRSTRLVNRLVLVHHWPESRYPSAARKLLIGARRFDLVEDEVYVSPAIAPRGATVIYNPMPAPSAPSPSTDSRAIDTDLLIVARHSAEKDLQTAVRALALLPGRFLTLVGSGPLTEMLQDLVARLSVTDRVIFVGNVANDTVREYLRHCEVLLLPSVWEAMPMVLLEAVAEGTAMVVSDITAHHHFIDSGAAIPFKTGDVRELIGAINATADDEVSVKLARGREVVAALHERDTILQRWLTILAPSEPTA